MSTVYTTTISTVSEWQKLWLHARDKMHVNQAECRCLIFVNLITWVYKKTLQFKLYKCHSFALRLYFRDSYEWMGNETLDISFENNFYLNDD